MKNGPKVSLAIPVYNREKVVGEAIYSILNQSFQDFEILLIDDGSSDESIKVIQSFTDSRIRLILNEQNRGIRFTRNRLVQEAKGKYIAFLDSDDLALSDRLEKQVAYLEAHPEANLVSGGCYFKSETSQKEYQNPLTQEELKFHLIFNNVLVTSVTTIRKSAVEKHQIQIHEDAFISEDYDLWTQLLALGEGCILNDILGIQQVDTDNSIFNETKAKHLTNLKKINGQIRRRYLEGLGVFFEEENWLGWVQFFEDYVGMNCEVQNEEELLKAISKMRTHFNNSKFDEILKFYILRNLRVMRLGLFQKLYYGSYLLPNLTIKDKIHIFIDYMARKILRR